MRSGCPYQSVSELVLVIGKTCGLEGLFITVKTVYLIARG
jgi:hypothetical protein